MNLIIDIGNTRVKLAVIDANNQVIYLKSMTQDVVLQEIESLISTYGITHAIASQVGNPVANLSAYLSKRHIELLFVSSKLRLPFKMDYETPDTIGADRLALVAGAMLHKQHCNQLIIDAGTCVTYDFVDDKNVYHGGAIAPGLALRYKSLNDYTANLPFLTNFNGDLPLVGKNTNMSIHVGVLGGVVTEIEATIVKYNLKFNDLTVYLTGGDEKLLDRYIKNKIFVGSKFLLMEGMNHILNLNK